MEYTSEQIEQILAQVKEGGFHVAASAIVSESDTSDGTLEAIEEALSSLQTPTRSKIICIVDAYSKYSGNLAQLKNVLSTVMGSGVDTKQDKQKEPGFLKDLNKLSDEQLSSLIMRVKAEQSAILSKGMKLDTQLAGRLDTLLQEQRRRKGDTPLPNTERIENTTAQSSTATAEGKEHWFVLPDIKELGKSDDVMVVTGSPVIEVLRARYMKANKLETVPQFSPEALKAMGGDEEYEAERELDKQRDFVDAFKESDKIMDRDIFVHQIASKFTTAKFTWVEPITDSKDKLLKHYYLSSGDVRIRYDFEKKIHSVDVVGTIPGRFAIAIKRRTDSGRIIDDAYAIVEIQDGLPIFYAHSSKGVIAISNVDVVRRTAARFRTTLAVPESARVASKKEIDGLKQPLNKEAKKDDKAKAIVSPEPEIGASVSSSRAQLAQYITEGASQTTIHYLVEQISKEENKSIEDVSKEFGLDVNALQPKAE